MNIVEKIKERNQSLTPAEAKKNIMWVVWIMMMFSTYIFAPTNLHWLAWGIDTVGMAFLIVLLYGVKTDLEKTNKLSVGGWVLPTMVTLVSILTVLMLYVNLYGG
jgi:hypothetical protein